MEATLSSKLKSFLSSLQLRFSWRRPSLLSYSLLLPGGRGYDFCVSYTTFVVFPEEAAIRPSKEEHSLNLTWLFLQKCITKFCSNVLENLHNNCLDTCTCES